MSSAVQLLDAAGRRRSPATMPDFHAGRAPGNKGQRYAADPPTVDEIIAVMRHARHARYGNRLNGLIVVLWRAGLRINEALSLNETDLEERRGSILVRHGKNDRRRQVGMDAWGWSALGPWLSERATLPVGPLFCVIAGPTRGHAWSAGAARLQLHQIALEAGVRRRFAPHHYADLVVMPMRQMAALRGMDFRDNEVGITRRRAVTFSSWRGQKGRY